MGIPHATVVELQSEGISNVQDLVDFDKDSFNNQRRPGGWVPDPNPAAGAGATTPTPPFMLGAKSQTRIAVVCNLVGFYETVGRESRPNRTR